MTRQSLGGPCRRLGGEWDEDAAQNATMQCLQRLWADLKGHTIGCNGHNLVPVFGTKHTVIDLCWLLC